MRQPTNEELEKIMVKIPEKYILFFAISCDLSYEEAKLSLAYWEWNKNN